MSVRNAEIYYSRHYGQSISANTASAIYGNATPAAIHTRRWFISQCDHGLLDGTARSPTYAKAALIGDLA
jgi:hypothetical protein